MDNITVNGLAMLAFATDEQLEQWKLRTQEKQESAHQRRSVIRAQIALGYTEVTSRPEVNVYAAKRPNGYIELMYRKSIIEDEDQLQEGNRGRYVKTYSRSNGTGYTRIGPGGNRSGNRKHVNYYDRRYTQYDRYSRAYTRYDRYDRYTRYDRYDRYDRRAPERRREERRREERTITPTRPADSSRDTAPRYFRRYTDTPVYTVGPTRPTYYYDRPTYYYRTPDYTPYVPEYTPSGSYNRTDFENAAIKHTTKWEENRKEYNEMGINRPANTFFAGEKFIIDATFTTDSSGSYDDSKTLKKVSIKNTSYSTNLIETTQNGTTVKQTAVLWDNSMIKKWGDGKKHEVTFVLELNDGTKKEVTAYVKNTTIDFLHRG